MPVLTICADYIDHWFVIDIKPENEFPPQEHWILKTEIPWTYLIWKKMLSSPALTKERTLSGHGIHDNISIINNGTVMN
jgi:hypothetical protein